MRLFAALLLPDDFRGYAADVQKRICNPDLPVKWVAAGNYHLTVKFLGETHRQQADRISEVIRERCSVHSPFSLQAGGLGCFPNRRKPRVIWLGMDGETDIALNLLNDIDSSLQAFGYKKDNHRLHLTLGRVRQGREAECGEKMPAGVWDSPKSGESPRFKIEAVHLMESQLFPTGPEYRVVARYPLGNG